MLEIIPADRRNLSDFGWLKTYWLFSFANYYDPKNIQFGALRVFNDDIVQPRSGFPTHPHHEMEIITIVLDGEMTHKDSMGNTSVIKTGDVQRMSAGTGLTHSEFNLADKPVHFYQIWIFPDKPKLEPSYAQKHFEPDIWKNKIAPVASGQGIEDTVSFHTDATIYRSDLEKGKSIEFDTENSRKIFIYLTGGRINVNGEDLNSGDQARIDLESAVNISAADNSSLILIDVPSCKGWGYDKETLKGEKVSK